MNKKNIFVAIVTVFVIVAITLTPFKSEAAEIETKTETETNETKAETETNEAETENEANEFHPELLPDLQYVVYYNAKINNGEERYYTTDVSPMEKYKDIQATCIGENFEGINMNGKDSEWFIMERNEELDKNLLIETHHLVKGMVTYGFFLSNDDSLEKNGILKGRYYLIALKYFDKSTNKYYYLFHAINATFLLGR